MKWLKKLKNNQGQLDLSEYHNEFAFIFFIFSIVSPFIGWLAVKALKLGSVVDGERTGDFFTNLGVYGDFLGGSTLPFLTLITIAYVYKTFKLQEEQLMVQKKEMEATRGTLIEQTKTAQLQRFENTFFIQLKDMNEKEKKDTYYGYVGQGRQQPLNKSIIADTDTLIRKINSFIEENWDVFNNESFKDTRWKLYKEEMQGLFENDGLIFKNVDFQKYIFSILRCFQLLNKYKGVMDDDEVRYYLRYIIDEIGEENYRLSMLYAIVFAERYDDFFKAIKDLKLHKFILFDDWFDKRVPSALTFIYHAFEVPDSVF
ncbi:hypothetical protein LJR015_001402 [Peribacillus frigoritolerans]|uniref:hypothetical protein n=1 Tax=Peribacillus frigoritolerans TaxID=450367 RepID=UPI003ECDA13A